jgi:hypothetical protein
MQVGIEAGERLAQGLSCRFRQRVVVRGFEMFARDDRVFGEQRCAVMQAKIGHAHRQMGAQRREDRRLAAQRPLRLFALRELEDEMVIDREGARMPAAGQWPEGGVGEIGMARDDRGTKSIDFVLHGQS